MVKKRPRNRCKLQHFTPFKKDAKKWRENRESLVSNVETADPCLLKVGHSEMLMQVVCQSLTFPVHFVTSRFQTHLKSISFQK